MRIWYKWTILDINNLTFYRLVNEIHLPKFIFVIFDLLNENDNGDEFEFIEYERRKQYNLSLLNILKKVLFMKIKLMNWNL